MTATPNGERTLVAAGIARVEGEGAMTLRIEGGHLTEVALRIYEPPRFFEAFLRGRRFSEPPDITARICGICPVAYQMSACQAIEALCGVTVDGPLRDLRRLVYFGEWIESHVLHLALLHAPDFLGFDNAWTMAAASPAYREAVQRGLRLKKIGNSVVEAVGGRPIHPVNIRVGGFYRVPDRRDLEPLAGELAWAREAALATVEWVAGLPVPDFEADYRFVALRHPAEYAILDGRVASSFGLDVPVADFERHLDEQQVRHSTALHATVDGERYLTGPLARYALNRDRLAPVARDAADAAGLGPVCRNPFRSIVVRAVETLHACDEALRIIEAYTPPPEPAVPVTPRPGVACGASEAPRGLLYHRYDLDGEGIVTGARIVPPTSQNQAQIEDDLRRFAERRLDESDADLTRGCEWIIRNHDPCISCAAHFLDLTVERA